jgi:S1-C subfamily serine protease
LKLKLSILFYLIFISHNLLALQLGVIKVDSKQGEALSAVIDVTFFKSDEDSNTKIAIASKENYEANGISHLPIHSDIQVTLKESEEGAKLFLTSKEIAKDPFLDLLIQIDSEKGIKYKEYTVLLDPSSPEKISVSTGGGYVPKNEQESNKPDVDERKDPPKTYKAQEEENPNSAGLNNNKLLPAASGSGFAISKDGYVLTNHHVINGCQALNIHTNGKLISARLIASDPINDLALIKGNFKPQTVFYINPSTPKLTDDIYVAGYPFGYAISSEIKITRGAVNSLSGLGNNFSQMQIDAAIQPGNSGGPVLDKKGNVFGIAVAKLNMQAVFEDYGVIPENTNFAIKSTVAKSFAESNNIHLISKSSYKNTDLREYISNGTYYLSCMMTLAKIKEMTTQKVFFKNITK